MQQNQLLHILLLKIHSVQLQVGEPRCMCAKASQGTPSHRRISCYLQAVKKSFVHYLCKTFYTCNHVLKTNLTIYLTTLQKINIR